MKKTKQRNVYEDKSDPIRNLDMQLEGDDDDIIELEDIIEMPDRPIDEDEDLDLGVDMLDMDEELQSQPARGARRPAGPREKVSALEAEEEDLLESLADDMDEEETLFEPTSPVSKKKSPAEKAQMDIFDEEDESILDDLLAEPVASDARKKQKAQPDIFDEEDESILDDLLDEPSDARLEEKVDLRARTEAAMRVAEKERLEEVVAASSSEPAGKAEAPAPASGAGASVSEISAAAEELIGGIESRLQEHIRAVVESMLPGLVRSIIDEEIAKLKKELE